MTPPDAQAQPRALIDEALCFLHRGDFMKLVKTMSKMGMAALMASVVATPAQAGQKICVYDLLGTSGDLFNMAKDYGVAMQKHGATIELKGYTDERVASEDFRTGQCDAVIATAFRTRQFNAVAGAV